MFDKDLSGRLRTCTVLIKEYQECQKIFLDNSNNYHYVKSIPIKEKSFSANKDKIMMKGLKTASTNHSHNILG